MISVWINIIISKLLNQLEVDQNGSCVLEQVLMKLLKPCILKYFGYCIFQQRLCEVFVELLDDVGLKSLNAHKLFRETIGTT